MAEPDEPLAFTLRVSDEEEIDPSAVLVSVDERVVTSECEVRIPRRWPADRADFAYRPPAGWAAGSHRVTVEWPGRTDVRTWSFEVR